LSSETGWSAVSLSLKSNYPTYDRAKQQSDKNVFK
jgi:hypothetical protein